MSLKQLEQNECRVVVLGANGSNKTSVISTLFGQTEYTCVKRTHNCVKTEGLVDGRKFIFVDTPGWWRNYRLIDTAEFIKRKLVLSMSECAPGPHTFMLVVNTDMPFSEKDMTATKEHLGLFGEKVWEHTIVVFTREEALGNLSIEQFIESGGEPLRSLIKKCENRCLYCYRKEGLLNKVKKILEMIDAIIAKNGGHYYEFDERMLQVVKQKRMKDHERGKYRRLKVDSQREIMTKQGSLPELRLVLLGWMFSGKTFARNIILGLKDKERIRTERSERKSGKVAKRQISVVDTPGWHKYFPARYIPERVKTEIQRGLTLDSTNAHAILLAVPVDTTFLEEQRKITEDNMKMFDEQVWRHTIVLFTCGDLLGDTSIEEHIESEGEPLRWLVEKCGNRYHVLSWSDEEDQVLELLKKIEEMVTGNSLFCPPDSKAEKQDTVETIQKQSAQDLDLDWEKMDKASEEMIKSIWNETRQQKLENRRSINAFINFNDHDSEKSHDNFVKSTCLLSTHESGITDAATERGFTCDQSGHEDKDQASENHPGQMKRIVEITKREKARLEKDVTDRFQQML